jgi:arabinogalactan oligomer/maltooligosaccharide transport system permease protein
MALGQIFQEYGPITQFIKQQTGMTILFWGQPTPFRIGDYILTVDFARILIVIINIWIGIPYTVLSTTGILMNVPEDLYESARIDGASPITIYFKITLKYIVFVMGPSLITTFIGNFNSFGVIYLLTGGGPTTNSFYGSAGHTDLLVTWLFSLTMEGKADYKMASVIGILIFIISATISLIVYRNSASFKNEEDFA